MIKKRYVYQSIIDDPFVAGKMAFVSGPRQVGKTTPAKSLRQHQENYFNWDQSTFRKIFEATAHYLNATCDVNVTTYFCASS